MKFFASILLIFGLVTAIVAQYGIPDDDDEPPVRAPNPAFYVSKYQETPSQNQKVVTLPKATTTASYEQQRTQPQYSSSTVAAPSPVKITLASPQLALKEKKEPAYESVRVTPLAEQSYSGSAAKSIPVHKIEFKDDGYNSGASTYSTSQGRSVSPPVVVKSSLYSGQPTTFSSQAKAVPIVKYVLEDDTRGRFRMETVTGDGTTKLKSGQLKDLGGAEGPVQVMAGSYSYNGDDGKVYKVDWTADEAGFRATGAHLPTSH